MGGQTEAMWIAVMLASYVPTIVALFLIVRGAVARGRVVGLDVLDIVMVSVFSWAGAIVYFLIAFLRRRSEARTSVVAVLPAIEEDEATLNRVDEAYARAWAEARTAADDVLIDMLNQAGLGPMWTEPGRPQADLLLAIWRSGATPRSSAKQLREALGARSGRAGDLSRGDPVH